MYFLSTNLEGGAFMFPINDKLNVKISGKANDVAILVSELELLPCKVVSSGAVPNSQDDGVHVFINLNPHSKA